MNPFEQVHVQDVIPTFVVTDDAWLLQCAAVVHCVHARLVEPTGQAAHVGYVMKPRPQESQVDPMNPVEQVHVHAVLAPFDVTDDAWLLQCTAGVHCVHVG